MISKAVEAYLKNSRWDNRPNYDEVMNLWATLFNGDLKSVPPIFCQQMNFIGKQFTFLDEISKIPMNQRSNWVVLSFVNEPHLTAFFNNPLGKLKQLDGFYAIASPDFSVYPNISSMLNDSSFFKNRMCCNLSQRTDNLCIYTLSWTDESSYQLTMNGVEKGAIIAVSSDRVSKQNEKIFCKGFENAIRTIEPKSVIWNGKDLPCTSICKPEQIIRIPSRMRIVEKRGSSSSNQLWLPI